MIAKLLEKVTGRDDLERVAYAGDINRLNAYLKTRKVLVPRRPKRFLDVATFTQEQLLEQIRKDAQELSRTPFEPWILEVDGKKRLPVFSRQQKVQDFAGKVYREMNKVFSVGCVDFLLEDLTKNLEIDFVDLNLFSHKSWEIEIRRRER
jgi:hypothetical protein